MTNKIVGTGYRFNLSISRSAAADLWTPVNCFTVGERTRRGIRGISSFISIPNWTPVRKYFIDGQAQRKPKSRLTKDIDNPFMNS